MVCDNGLNQSGNCMEQGAAPGSSCRSPSGRRYDRPHTARLVQLEKEYPESIGEARVEVTSGSDMLKMTAGVGAWSKRNNCSRLHWVS
jgi:hypothetical protein